MVNRKMTTNYWRQNLTKLTTSAAENAIVPDATKEFLVTVGLPTNVNLLEPFGMELRFTVNKSKLHELTYEGTNYYIIGDDGSQVCLRSVSGEVVSIDVSSPLPIVFINSDLQNFILFLQMYSQAMSSLPPDGGEEEVVRRARNLEREFARIDVQALSDEDNWWPTILEEIYDFVDIDADSIDLEEP